MEVLRLDASLAPSCYLVSGRSRTVWVLDWCPPLPTYVISVRGEDSTPDSAVGRWLRLVEVAGVDPHTAVDVPGVIRVGERHRWTTNSGGRADWQESWVVQSRCTSIDPISREQVEALLAGTDAAGTLDDRR